MDLRFSAVILLVLALQVVCDTKGGSSGATKSSYQPPSKGGPAATKGGLKGLLKPVARRPELKGTKGLPKPVEQQKIEQQTQQQEEEPMVQQQTEQKEEEPIAQQQTQQKEEEPVVQQTQQKEEEPIVQQQAESKGAVLSQAPKKKVGILKWEQRIEHNTLKKKPQQSGYVSRKSILRPQVIEVQQKVQQQEEQQQEEEPLQQQTQQQEEEPVVQQQTQQQQEEPELMPPQKLAQKPLLLKQNRNKLIPQYYQNVRQVPNLFSSDAGWD